MSFIIKYQSRFGTGARKFDDFYLARQFHHNLTMAGIRADMLPDW